MLLSVAFGLVALVATGLALLTAYLIVLTVAALFARKRGPASGGAVRRFAILVPAHDEEALIGRLLTSLQQQDYPPDRFDVCVVADNCHDATADLARSMGARVYERVDADEQAKGFALRWLIAQLREEGRSFDAFVVFDADSVVDSNFLRTMDARLDAGSQVVQAYYSVRNGHQSAVAGLRYAALAAVHYVRPLGRSVFGLSCGLKGNGMCFTSSVVERFGWNWFTLAEDVEFHLALVRAGIRVDFAPETTVRAEMPITLAQAASQNARWERGRLQLMREKIPGLIWDGLRTRNLLQLDAAAEQLIPPLSVPFALSFLSLLASFTLGSPWLMALCGISLIGQLAYLVAGLVLVGAPRSTYLALSTAPLYIVWKFGLYGRALVSGRASSWVRTARIAPDTV
jgi:cellulose synthase/poly-beta-1,6-N-acetylglucosamine synthase-like glycosyltransferase